MACIKKEWKTQRGALKGHFSFNIYEQFACGAISKCGHNIIECAEVL